MLNLCFKVQKDPIKILFSNIHGRTKSFITGYDSFMLLKNLNKKKNYKSDKKCQKFHILKYDYTVLLHPAGIYIYILRLI